MLYVPDIKEYGITVAAVDSTGTAVAQMTLYNHDAERKIRETEGAVSMIVAPFAINPTNLDTDNVFRFLGLYGNTDCAVPQDWFSAFSEEIKCVGGVAGWTYSDENCMCFGRPLFVLEVRARLIATLFQAISRLDFPNIRKVIF